MSTITISNKNALNLDFIKTFGVSVKESDSPIGMFGTGLKYAIAVLLRNGCSLAVRMKEGSRPEQSYIFSTKRVELRGQTFDQVQLEVEDCSIGTVMPFTTDLGKNWSVLSALRELWSNARDEGVFEEGEDYTIWEIEGEALGKYQERDIFLDQNNLELILSTPDCDVYRGSTHKIYYRGVLALDVKDSEYSFSYTYNLKSATPLTEDRTLQLAGWSTNETLKKTLRELTKLGFYKHISDDKTVYENRTHWDDFGGSLTPSQIPEVEQLLMAFEAALKTGVKCEGHVLYYRKLLRGLTESFTELTPTQEQKDMLALACYRLRNRYPITQPIKITDELSNNVFAAYEPTTQIIWLATKSFDDAKTVARALVEEQAHHNTGLSDATRDMQNYLFDSLLEFLYEE